MITRRRFGAFFVACVSATALTSLAACDAEISVSVFESDAALILQGIEALADTSVQPLVSADVWAKIQGYETTAASVLTTLTGLGSTISLSSAQDIIAQIEAAADGPISALATYADLPPPITEKISAIQTLLPLVLVAVSLTTAAAKRRAARLTLTVAQARAVLSNSKI